VGRNKWDQREKNDFSKDKDALEVKINNGYFLQAARITTNEEAQLQKPVGSANI